MVLTTAQAAARLGVSVRRVQAMISAGRLVATRVGRDWLIAPEALAPLRMRKPGRPSAGVKRANRDRDDARRPGQHGGGG
jgi:excisionase family DNA binding protein